MPKQSIREKTDAIYKAREGLLNDLFELRKTCEHKSTNVREYGDLRRHNPANICLECDQFVSWAETKTEKPVVTFSTG